MKESEEHKARAARYLALADKCMILLPTINEIGAECIALGDHKLLGEIADLLGKVTSVLLKIREHRHLYVSQAVLAEKIGD